MADASETFVTEQEVALEAAGKKEDLEKTNGGEEVIPQKVEEPAPEGSAESSGGKAFEEVEGESKPEDVPTDVLAAETVVVAVPEANEPVVETVPDAKLEAEVVVLEAKTEEETAVETIPEVKQEDEPVKEVAANKSERIVSEARILEEEAAEAVPEEVIKEPEEPKEVAEAENEKQIKIPSVVEVVSEKAVIKEALEDKKEEGQETATPDAAEEAIAEEVIEDKAVVEEAVKEEKPTESEAKEESETGFNAKAAVAEATDPVKPEKKQSRNVISKMKRSLSKVKKAFGGKLPGSKTADSDVKAEEKAE